MSIVRGSFVLAVAMSLAACGSENEEPPTGRDRTTTDETGRTCTWCSDWECDFVCEPGSPCSKSEEWTFTDNDELKLCPICPGAGDLGFREEDCNVIVCETAENCVLTGYVCENQRCMYR